jgi:hypothetical protein
VDRAGRDRCAALDPAVCAGPENAKKKAPRDGAPLGRWIIGPGSEDLDACVLDVGEEGIKIL